jgi:hypothetical protein
MSGDLAQTLIVALAGAVAGALATFYLTYKQERSDRILGSYAAYVGAVEELIQILGSVVFNSNPEWLTFEFGLVTRIQDAVGRTGSSGAQIELLERDRDRYEALMQCQKAIFDCTVRVSTAGVPSDGSVTLARGYRPDRETVSAVRKQLAALIRVVRRDFSINLPEDFLRRLSSAQPTDEQRMREKAWLRDHIDGS